MSPKVSVNKATLVVWKHLIIRKRHWVLTLIEVCLPILLFCLLAYARAQIATVKKEYLPAQTHMEENLEYFDTQTSKILYAPQNVYTEDIVQRVQNVIQMPTSNVIGYQSEADLVGNYTKEGDSVFGIIFNNVSRKFSYKMRIYEAGITWQNTDLFDSHVFAERHSLYKQTRFLTLQHALDVAFIEKEANINLKSNVKMKAMPFPPRVEDPAVSTLYGDYLPQITIFSFLFLVPAIVQRVVEEKKSGIKELQKMMGLKDWMLWLGWFCHGIVPITFSIIGIVLLMKVPFWDVEYPPIEYTNAGIYFAFLMLYAISTICFCFLISTITGKPTFSIVIGILVWIFSYFFPSSIIKANGSTRLIKLAFWMFPNIALDQGYKTMQIFEQNEIGIQWNNLCELPLSNTNNLRMIEVLLIFAIQTVVYMIFTIYFDNINPGDYGIRKSILYPFKGLKKLLGSSEVGTEVHRLEEATQLTPGIQLINLTKRFGNHRAVDDITLNIYKDQITALLGHNGAGKTTVMHMLTGLIDSSSGSVLINDYDVKTQMDEVRRSLGLCPQHNLLFQDFTIMEHLVFFAMLKGCRREDAKREAKSLLRKLHILDKENTLAATLSGGMKRKLCLGMALIGNPKVLILDEPTSGMDPESRRAVWDILLKSRGSKTILITTHFLEEADVLGDQIAIMSHGKVLCHGSPLELKKQFHTGYHLTLSLETGDQAEKQHIEKQIKAIIESHGVSDVKQLKSYGKTIAYNLRLEDKEYFPPILNEVEDKKQLLRVENYSLNLTTLEDVFLKTMRVDHHHETDLDTEFNVKIEYNQSPVRFLPMLKKRMQCFKPRRWFYLFTLILVALLFFGNMSLCQNYLFGEEYHKDVGVPLNLNLYDKTTVYIGQDLKNNFFSNISDSYRRLVEEHGSKLLSVQNVDASVIEVATKDLEFYKRNVLFGLEFDENDGVNLFYSYSALHSAPISLNLYTNALLRTYMGDAYSIEVTSMPLVKMQRVEEQTKMIVESQILIIWSFLFPIGILLLMCPFIIFPYEELSTKFTSIEFMAGIKPVYYWICNIIGDSLILIVQIAAIVLVQLLQYTLPFNIFYTANIFWTFVAILCAMTISSLPYVYTFSRRKTLSGGIALFIILNLFLGIIPFMVVALLQAFGDHKWKTIGDILDVLLLVLCPAYGYTKLGGYFAQKAAQTYNWHEMTAHEKKLECLKGLYAPCCSKNDQQCGDYLSFSRAPDNTFCRDLGLMCFGMIVYVIINTMLDLDYMTALLHMFNSRFRRIGSRKDDDESFSGPASQPMNEPNGVYNFKATLLKKSYNKVVVNIKQIFVPKGKCYGFLGVNGAGKTTTFNLLTKQIINDNPRGSLCIGDKEYSKSSWPWVPSNDNYLSKLGYCPQADLLNFTLTGRELLTFIAEIRGIKNVPEVVDRFVKMFDLQEHQHKMVKTYSGGNKRKVCIAIAFLGIQEVVLLDEPTSGVDASSKRNFWKILKAFQYQNNLTTILTSHSMNECEALCDRLLIMKDAEIKKNDTISRLKQEISGYTIIFKIITKLESKKSMEYDVVDGSASSVCEPIVRLKNSMSEKFECCEITDEHLGSLQYHVKSNRLGRLFREVEEIKNSFPNLIEDYSISESSVEDIFLKVARDD